MPYIPPLPAITICVRAILRNILYTDAHDKDFPLLFLFFHSLQSTNTLQPLVSD